MATDRLSRETNPPGGQPACPEPQYKNVTTAEYEALKGRDGATFVEMKRRGLSVVPVCTTVNVTDTATALPASPLAGRHTVWVTNPSAAVSVYITDDSGAIGFQLFPEQQIMFPIDNDTVLLYAKVATGTLNVFVMEMK